MSIPDEALNKFHILYSEYVKDGGVGMDIQISLEINGFGKYRVSENGGYEKDHPCNGLKSAREKFNELIEEYSEEEEYYEDFGEEEIVS